MTPLTASQLREAPPLEGLHQRQADELVLDTPAEAIDMAEQLKCSFTVRLKDGRIIRACPTGFEELHLNQKVKSGATIYREHKRRIG